MSGQEHGILGILAAGIIVQYVYEQCSLEHMFENGWDQILYVWVRGDQTILTPQNIQVKLLSSCFKGPFTHIFTFVNPGLKSSLNKNR